MIYEIFDAVTEDIPAIQALARTLYEQQYAPDQAERLLSRVYSTESLQRGIESESTGMLVALDDDDQVVGYCRYGSSLLEECADIQSIHTLLVHPAHQRKGVGALFLETIEDDLDYESCVVRITVFVNPADRARLNFFLKNNFDHELTEDTENEWYLEKTL